MARILWNRRPEPQNPGGDIDEIVIDNVNVHIEQMDDNCWWIALYTGNTNEPYWMGNFICDEDGKMKFSEQENHNIDWDKDDEHIFVS